MKRKGIDMNLCGMDCKYCYAIYMWTCHPHIGVFLPEAQDQAFNDVLRVVYPTDLEALVKIKHLFHILSQNKSLCASSSYHIKQSLLKLKSSDFSFVKVTCQQMFQAWPCKILNCQEFCTDTFCDDHKTLLDETTTVLSNQDLSFIVLEFLF